VTWSAGGAVLYVREPLLVEGRLVGAVTIADAVPLHTSTAWGIDARRGCQLVLGRGAPNARPVRTQTIPGVEIHVGSRCLRGVAGFGLEWQAWLVLVVVALLSTPRWAWLVVLVAGTAYLVAPGRPTETGMVVLVLAAGAAVGRLVHQLRGRWAWPVALTSVLAAAVIALVINPVPTVQWLPTRLLRPGWGGVLIVSIAWIVSALPGRNGRSSHSFERRLTIAGSLAVLALILELASIPVSLLRADRAGREVALPRGVIDLERELPQSPESCRLDDLAPKLAAVWGLDGWRTPSELRLASSDRVEISRWGDLSPAGDHVMALRSWRFPELEDARLELYVATEPWSLLRDWQTGAALDVADWNPVWFAVLTRSGAVVATLHPEIGDLGAAVAGELFYADGGWTRFAVGQDRVLGRVWRRGEWLVAAVARSPEPSVWVLRAAMGFLWALCGLLMASPPVFRSSQMSTFGGRLRLLVAGGVVVPLVALTLLLQVRLRQQEIRLEQVRGLEALESARYTAEHLSGGFEVDDDLARWLSVGWGGEVVLFEGADVVAVSRPDLMSSGALPQLPAAVVFPAFLVGRDDPTVLRTRRRLVAAGAVDLEGRRYLLELIRLDPIRARDTSGAVDWLLTGSLLAALLALVLTSRIERRLSGSLRDLVALARRLLHGEPVGAVRRPPETDLAEVIAAVRSMNEQVQQRELSLRSQEELLRITLSTLTPAVLVQEPGGRLRFSNPSAERLRDIHGDLVLEVVHDLVREDDLSSGPKVETVQPIPGQDLTWRIGAAAVPFPDGGRGLVAVIDDVTDVMRIDRLHQLNQLARIVAHEVKNPLTPVRLWVQELEEARRRGDARLDALVEEACREISVQVERLQETANSFSNLVAFERWHAEIVDLAEVVRVALDDQSILARRGIDLRRHLAQPGRCLVRGDRQWLRRAFDNLLKNSIDALAGERGEIRVSVDRSDGLAVLEVEDTAGGITESMLLELFSPHFSTTSSGSGLGLALVHQVVTRCHGRVAAANGSRGLVVRLEFPLASGPENSPS
jgi:signal transduction histidine kinase